MGACLKHYEVSKRGRTDAFHVSFLSCPLSFLFSVPWTTNSQREKDGDHTLKQRKTTTLITQTEIALRHGVSQESNENTGTTPCPPPSFFTLSVHLVLFIPSLNPLFPLLLHSSVLPPIALCFFPSLGVGACVLYVCEGRCLPAGCQVTSLIEGPLESRCYQRLNPLFRLPLSLFLLFTPSLFSSLAL